MDIPGIEPDFSPARSCIAYTCHHLALGRERESRSLPLSQGTRFVCLGSWAAFRCLGLPGVPYGLGHPSEVEPEPLGLSLEPEGCVEPVCAVA